MFRDPARWKASCLFNEHCLHKWSAKNLNVSVVPLLCLIHAGNRNKNDDCEKRQRSGSHTQPTVCTTHANTEVRSDNRSALTSRSHLTQQRSVHTMHSQQLTPGACRGQETSHPTELRGTHTMQRPLHTSSCCGKNERKGVASRRSHLQGAGDKRDETNVWCSANSLSLTSRSQTRE